MKQLGQSELLQQWYRSWFLWWKEQTVFRKVFPGISICLYWLVIGALGGFTGDHLTVGVLLFLLSYGGRALVPLLEFCLPFLLTSIVYDSQRHYSDYIRGPIHVTEPYNFDKTFFGISTPQGVLTPNEWFQIHTHPVLDVIMGFYYLAFFAIFMGVAAYFYFWLTKKGTPKFSASEMKVRVPRVIWGFFWLNMLGYSTYYWYAAAPPWYVTKYGLGPPNMSAVASSAGCVRFDQVLGTHFFSELYSRSADVFGAIPSLHVAFPLLAFYYAIQFGAAQFFCLLFYGCMVFAAVYFNHHYVLDVIWGSCYAVIIGVITDQVYSRYLLKNSSIKV